MEFKRFMITYEIRNIVRAFTVYAINESYALDACYCENAMGEDGEDTYKVHSCMEVAKKRKYNVEMRESNEDCFDNWIGDYIEADSEEEAILQAIYWLKEHGYDRDIDEIEFQVSEYN